MAGKKLDSVKYTNMFKAYGAFWRRGFTEWAGTASRSEYWWNVLMNALIGLAALFVYFFFAVLGLAVESEGVIIFGSVLVFVPLVIYYLAVLVPWISLTVRRLHDAGLSSWFMALYGAGIFLGFLSPLVVAAASPFSRGALGFATFLDIISFCISITFFVFALLPTKVDGNPYHQFNRQ